MRRAAAGVGGRVRGGARLRGAGWCSGRRRTGMDPVSRGTWGCDDARRRAGSVEQQLRERGGGAARPEKAAFAAGGEQAEVGVVRGDGGR